MPEITELLEQAAPGAAGPAPFDDIVRRGRRRQLATRAVAVAAPLAVAAVVAGVILTGGTPTGIEVVDPPMAETPDPSPTPEPSTTEPSEPAPGDATEPESPDATGWVEPSGMAADLLVIQADGGTPQVVRMGADGSLDDQVIDAGVPNSAGLLPDPEGGFTWQPDWESADPAPVLHVDGDGQPTTLFVGDEPGSVQLVGWDLGLGRPLVTERRGDDIQDMTADLLSVPLDGGDAELVREEVGAWEVGVSHAAMLETALYDQYVEAMQNLVLDPPDDDPQVLYEAGEITGEDIAGVGISEESWSGVALVSRMGGLEDDQAARLLIVDLTSGEITDEVDVPLDLGLADGAMEELQPQARDVSIQGDHVLVNRLAGGAWLPPVVHDLRDGEWSMLEHRDGGPITGRAFLAPAIEQEPSAEQAACTTEDQHLRNAEPPAGELSLYLHCKDDAEPVVYPIPLGGGPTGDVEQDLYAVLSQLVEPLVGDELVERGYYAPADRGQPLLHSVEVGADGHAVVDLGFPNGVGNLSTSAGGARWHQSLLGTIFQFPQVETLELRLDGSCEDYALAFEGDGCRTFGRDMAPWNSSFGA